MTARLQDCSGSVKHGEELIIITGLDTGADPELSLARTLSGTHTHTHTPPRKLASIHAHTHVHTHTHTHTIQTGNQTSAPGGKKKCSYGFLATDGVYWVHMKNGK